MNRILLTLEVSRPRDLISARRRTRQVVGLLGFGAREQNGICAAVFELAHTAYRRYGQLSLQYRVVSGFLQVFPVLPRQASFAVSDELLVFQRALPAGSATQPVEDLEWMVGMLDRVTPPGALEEFARLNRDYLGLLHELQMARKELERMKAGKRRVAA